MSAVLLAAALCAGAVKFDPPVRYAVAADRAVLVRDLDGDGVADILTSGDHVDEQPAFSMLVNRGDGTFAGERLLPSTFGERIEDIGDVDADGTPDLLVSNYWSNGIALYRKGAVAAYATATHGGPSLIADYDRDGKPDVVSFSFGSGNLVRVHLFHSALEPRKTFDTTLANADSPSFRILNGVLEIVASGHSGLLGLFRFVNGSVVVNTIAAGPGIDLSCVFADVDGDGIADIVHANNDVDNGREPIFVALAKADGTFLPSKQLTSPPQVTIPAVIRASDVDGDGHIDLVVRDFGATSVYFYRGDGAGNFAAGVAIDAGAPVNDIAVADVNGDGRPDIVTANDDRTVSVLINRGPCVAPRRHAVRR